MIEDFDYSEQVFSTYVEVILNATWLTLTNSGFLHVCGGDPCLIILAVAPLPFSPRMWR